MESKALMGPIFIYVVYNESFKTLLQFLTVLLSFILKKKKH